MANFLSKVRIDGVDASIKDESLTAALNTEITTRTAEDARMDAAIAAETAARTAADQALQEALDDAIESVVSVETVPDKFVRLKLHRFANSDIYHFSFTPSSVEVVAPNGNTAAPRPNTVPLLTWAAANNPDFVINGGFRGATYFNGTYFYDPDDESSAGTVYLGLKPDSIYMVTKDVGIAAVHAAGYDNIVASVDPVITNGQRYNHGINPDLEANYDKTATRMSITVDNGYWEVFVIAGRTPFNKGMTFEEQENFFLGLGYRNVYSLDGGGSVGVCAGAMPMIPVQDWADTEYGRDNLINFIKFTI